MKVIILACLSVVVACVPAAPRVSPQPCPTGGIAATAVRPPNDQPTPTTMFAPPTPVPAGVLGHRASIRVVVDTGGRVMPDSITICGVADPAYARRLAEAVATVRFVAARRDISVAGPTEIGFLIR
jgi:hypothetical protein